MQIFSSDLRNLPGREEEGSGRFPRKNIIIRFTASKLQNDIKTAGCPAAPAKPDYHQVA
jgi:hypothetical protein